MVTDGTLVVTHMVAVSSRCIEALVMFISSSIVVLVRCVSCPAPTGLGHMCTDLGQHAEHGVSDLGHRGQPEEAVSHWESLSRFMVYGQDWHARFGWTSFGIQDSYKIGIQDLDKYGIQEALNQVIWHKRMLQAIV